MRELLAILIVITLVCCLAFFEPPTKTVERETARSFAMPSEMNHPSSPPTFRQPEKEREPDWQGVGF